MAVFIKKLLNAAGVGALVLALNAPIIPQAQMSLAYAGIEDASSAMFSRRLTLGSGRTLIVDLPAEASEVIVGDPKVANAIVRSARKLYVMGIANGQTSILALDRNGHQIANLELTVGRDIEELMKLLQMAVPRSRITVSLVNDSVVLGGEAYSSGDSATAMDVAKAFVFKSGGPGLNPEQAVINAVTVRAAEQVMVKLTIAEVQRTVLKQLGVSTSPVGADLLLNNSWITFAQQNPFALNGQLSQGAFQIPLSGNLAATVQAFERYGVSRTLAEPTVTAISGETAKFTVGGEIPVPQSSNCTPGAMSGGNYCTVGIAFKPYGITLNMTPVVLNEGRILLRMATEVTEVDTTKNFKMALVSIPGFRTRKNETSVELPSGASIATAGLITNSSRHAMNGLPGLNNLPILGALFRSRDYQRDETELMIIVTPYLAKPVQSNKLARPDDGFMDATDPQAVLLGRINKLYSSRSNPQAAQNWKGRVGFIHD